jgi:uncharacterized protein (TIGR02118 family)
MVKLTVLYKKPADPQTFDDYYKNVHTPLALKIPGLRRLEVAKITGGGGGESPYHLIAELYFDDMNSLNQGMASPEGKASGKDVNVFAKGLAEFIFSEVEEKAHASLKS